MKSIAGKVFSIAALLGIAIFMFLQKDPGREAPVSAKWMIPFRAMHTSLEEHVRTLPPCTTVWTFRELQFEGRTYEEAHCSYYHFVTNIKHGSLTLLSHNREVVTVMITTAWQPYQTISFERIDPRCGTIEPGLFLYECGGYPPDYRLLFMTDERYSAAVIFYTRHKIHIPPEWTMDWIVQHYKRL